MNATRVIHLIRMRDDRGMDELLLHYGPLMRYVISPILPDPLDREECLSEAAMRVWEHIQRFDPEKGSWTAWLTAVTRNAALNRAKKYKDHLSTEELSPDLPSPQPTPEEELLRRERQEAVRRALYQLPDRDRRLFYRKYYYFQSTAQIAAELNLTERAVEGRLYRIKKRLRDRLGGDAHD